FYSGALVWFSAPLTACRGRQTITTSTRMHTCPPQSSSCFGLSTHLPSGNCLRSGFRRTNPGQRLHERNAAVIRFVDHDSKAFSLKITHHAEQDELLRPPERT